MGLRHLYFLIGGVLDRLVYLSYGLSLILAFVGVKLLLNALRHNTLPFINAGRQVSAPAIPTGVSLLVIVAVLRSPPSPAWWAPTAGWAAIRGSDRIVATVHVEHRMRWQRSSCMLAA